MKILILEDEIRVAKHLEKLIRELLGSQITSVKTCNYLEEAQEYLSKHLIDVLFLDLNLNGKNGFDILHSLVASSFFVIVVSAFRDQALKAFEYGVLDFIHKPVNRIRLQQTVDRILGKSTLQVAQPQFIAVKKLGRVKLLPLQDILYIQAEGHYSNLFLQNKQYFFSEKSLEKFETLLPSVFVRIHKSYIANINRAKALIPKPGGHANLELIGEVLLPIGRSRMEEVKKHLV